MNEIPELVIGGIYVMPIILALVEVAKAIGLDVKFAPLLNGTLCLVFYAVSIFLKQRPDLETVAVWILTAMILFLVNAGFYNVAAKSAVRAVRGQ